MAHFDKYTLKAAILTLQHDRREKEGIRDNIDESRSYMNYNLCDCDDELVKLKGLIHKAKSSGAYMRDNTNVVVSCVITIPEDFLQNDSLKREFFKSCYDLLCKDFGEENMLSAWVHCDECLNNKEHKYKEHIHIKFCPVAKKEKHYKNGATKTVYSFDAKNLVNKTYLQTFHNRLEQHLTEHLGFTPTIQNGATKSGNKSIRQLKAETREKELLEKDKQEEKIRAKILNKYWKEYQRQTAIFWKNYKEEKEKIKSALFGLKNDYYDETREITRGLDLIGNTLQHGLFIAVCMLIVAICMRFADDELYKEINRLESDLEGLESIRRSVSNKQHNTKEKLKEKDFEAIERTLYSLEKDVAELDNKIKMRMILAKEKTSEEENTRHKDRAQALRER